jgi:HAD superfamily hydrolase (TIGR01490 family)
LTLAIFDLDKTLLAGDSDHAWGEFLVARGLVDGDTYKRYNDRFYAAYQAGELDIGAYLTFALQPLAEHDLATLRRWHSEFMRSTVTHMITPAARALVDQHRAAGHTLIIITSTNDFVAEPIARAFGVEILIATEAEIINGRYTGRFCGIPCYRDGKVARLRAWLQSHAETLADSWCYSDSHNDLPLLAIVDHPVAVNPDAILQAYACDHGWPILMLH